MYLLNGIVCCLWKPKAFQSKHKWCDQTKRSPNCTASSFLEPASLRIEQVEWRSNVASRGSLVHTNRSDAGANMGERVKRAKQSGQA